MASNGDSFSTDMMQKYLPVWPFHIFGLMVFCGSNANQL
jgi:hypothetical protein